MNWTRRCFFLVGSMSWFACSNAENELIQTRELLSFETIELNSSFEIYLQEGPGYLVRLKGQESRLHNVHTVVENGVLKVTDENNVKWLAPSSNKIELLITAPRFVLLSVNETCSIRTQEPLQSEWSMVMGNKAKLVEANLELNGGSFYYWNNYQCGGRLTLSGNTTSIQLFTFSSMSVDAERLATDYARIESNSKGNCFVTVRNQLEYSIRGIGNIYFRGDPQVTEMERTSTGKLIKLD